MATVSAAPETAERDELIRRVEEAEYRTLDYWVQAVTSSATGSMTVKAMQSSMSWKLTKPLRAGLIVYTRVRSSGVRNTAVMVRERLSRMRQARKRG